MRMKSENEHEIYTDAAAGAAASAASASDAFTAFAASASANASLLTAAIGNSIRKIQVRQRQQIQKQ